MKKIAAIAAALLLSAGAAWADGLTNGGSSGGGGTPGGSSGQAQYNNASSFGGISGATTDGTTLTLVAPVLGAATATSINKVAITAPASASTLTIANGKTLTVNTSLTLAGTDTTTMTFPSTSATIARTDAANTFTGVQTFSTPIAVGSVATMSATVGGSVPTPPNDATKFLNGQGAFTTPAGGGTGCVPAGTIHNVLFDDGAGGCTSDASANLTLGALTLGASGTVGTVTVGNATSGTIKLQAIAGALGTVTLSLPAATDTLIGKATTDTLTNKTYDTAGTGNSFSINSVAATANTGTGAVARAAGPTFTTPTLGVAGATSLALGGATIGSDALGITGTVTVSGAITHGIQQTTQGSIVLANTAAGAFATTIKSSNSASAAYTLTLPTTAGTNGYSLTTNGSGVTSWTNVSGGSGCAPAGSATQVLTDSGSSGCTSNSGMLLTGTGGGIETASIGFSTASSVYGACAANQHAYGFNANDRGLESAIGGLAWCDASNNTSWVWGNLQGTLTSGYSISFTNSATNAGTGTADTGISRDSAGVLDVGTGAAASHAGTVYAGGLRLDTASVMSNYTSAGSYTPTDQSGAGLTFTSVSASYTQIGNMVFVYGVLTYPTTADTSAAKISLPITVPNQNYAQTISTTIEGGTGGTLLQTVINTTTAAWVVAAGTAQTNVTLTGRTLHFFISYPAS